MKRTFQLLFDRLVFLTLKQGRIIREMDRGEAAPKLEARAIKPSQDLAHPVSALSRRGEIIV